MPDKQDIDTRTLRLLKHGDEKAFEVVFRKYFAKIHQFVSNTLYDKSTAEDIAQNVFLILWEHRTEINTEKNFSAYLFTIAKNLVYRETERMILSFNYKDFFLNNSSGEEDFSTIQTIDANLLEETILKLIDNLPDARKRIFLLRFKDDLSNKEIAEKLSISVENVEMQVGRSLKYIRSKIKPN
jgi:RNA polymerase sigma-70 factor (ECF subfamily)